jgi:hypothetical protein
MKKFLRCDCGHGGVYIEYIEDCHSIDMCYYEYPTNRSWRNRLKLAWGALKGKPYADMVCLNDEKIADLVDFLIDVQNINN